MWASGEGTLHSWKLGHARAPVVMASKNLVAQQAALSHWQVRLPESSQSEVWRPTFQSGLQVGACSQACGLHVERHRCLEAASIAGWVPASKIA